MKKTELKKKAVQKSTDKPLKEKSKLPATKKTGKGSVNIGRPTVYNDKLATEICKLVMLGYSLRSIGDMETMPCRDTINNWFLADPVFFDQYTRARAIQVENMADEIIAIADDTTNDKLFNPVTERWEEDREVTATKKLRVEARLQLMKLQAPKRFGSKPDINITNEKGVTNVQVNYNFPSGWEPPKIEE